MTLRSELSSLVGLVLVIPEFISGFNGAVCFGRRRVIDSKEPVVISSILRFADPV